MLQETFDALNAETDWFLQLLHLEVHQSGREDAIRDRTAARALAFGLSVQASADLLAEEVAQSS